MRQRDTPACATMRGIDLGILVVFFQMVDVGGQFADRHLVGLDEQYIHQVAFDRNRPVFFGGSRNLDFYLHPICCGGYFSAASCRRNSKRLDSASAALGQFVFIVALPNFDAQKRMVGQHFAHVDNAVFFLSAKGRYCRY